MPKCRVCRVYVGFISNNIMCSSTRCANFMKYLFVNQFLNITKGCAICYFSKFLILLICNATILLNEKNCFLLAIVELKRINNLPCQPIPP